MLCDVGHFYTRAYVHLHNLKPNPSPYTQQGPIEGWKILHKIRPLVVGEGQSPSDKHCKFYNSKPHKTMGDNFPGDEVEDLIGTVGYVGMQKTRRDCLPCGFGAK